LLPIPAFEAARPQSNGLLGRFSGQAELFSYLVCMNAVSGSVGTAASEHAEFALCFAENNAASLHILDLPPRYSTAS